MSATGQTMHFAWSLELLGRLRAIRNQHVITRFESRKTAALLIALALRPDHQFGREELAELLWPEVAPETGRNRLKQALASLRRQFEPPDTPAGSVLAATRSTITLCPDAIVTDVSEFRRYIKEGRSHADAPRRKAAIEAALDRYAGELLPGWYEDWVLAERDLLAAEYQDALTRLMALQEEERDRHAAITTGIRLLQTDPLSEEAHAALIRLYIASGQQAAAVRQYRELEKTLREELDEAPSEAVAALVDHLKCTTDPKPVLMQHPEATRISAPAASGERHAETTAKRPEPRRPSQLPQQFSRFFGRHEEIAYLCRRLAAAKTGDLPGRLITLTGPGGAGKTRLAVETAMQMRASLADRCRLVALADVRDSRLIPAAIAESLNLPHNNDSLPMDQIVSFLSLQTESGAYALLVVDNFEHLVEEGADVIRQLLDRVPRLICLITSRHKLFLAGEEEFRVPPLATPNLPGTPDRLMEFACVQLFVDRAQKARPDFQVTARNAEAVTALCRRLEGLPLAIELTAAWAQTLSPSQMLKRLTRRFDLLVSRRKDLPQRHRSLLATIEWSCDRLPEEARGLFKRLAVFRGGWSLEAAEAICVAPTGAAGTGADAEGDGKDADDTANTSVPSDADGPSAILDLLTVLVDRSLVSTEETGDTIRFRMLESLHEYASEQLTAAERRQLEIRHADYFAAIAEESPVALRAAKQIECLAQLDLEHDNIRIALRRSLENGDSARALRIASAMCVYWEIRGHLTEGRAWLKEALSQPHEADGALARGLLAAGNLTNLQGDREQAVHLLKRGLEIHEQAGDDRGIADALHLLSVVAFYTNDYAEAEALQRRALTLRENGGEDWAWANSLNMLALIVRRSRKDDNRARVLFEQSLSRALKAGDRRAASYTVYNLANLHKEAGDFARAEALMEQSETLSREVGDLPFLTYILHNLGAMAIVQQNDARGFGLQQEALRLCHAIGDRSIAAFSLWNLAEVLYRQHDYANSMMLLHASIRLCEECHMPLTAEDQAMCDDITAASRKSLGEKRTEAAAIQGRLMSLEQSVIAVNSMPIPSTNSEQPASL